MAHAPASATPKALTNIDVIHQILQNADIRTIRRCLGVSTHFNTAAIRVLYNQVSLTAERVLHIIDHSDQYRPLNRIKKNELLPLPLPIFAHTKYLKIAIHDDGLPDDWMDKMVSIFPSVRMVSIQYTGRRDCCRRRVNCLQMGWIFASKLPIVRITANLRQLHIYSDGSRRYDYHWLTQLPIFPTRITFPTCVLALIIPDIEDAASNINSLLWKSTRQFPSEFASIQLVIDPIARTPYVTGGRPGKTCCGERLASVWKEDYWTKSVYTYAQFAQEIIDIIRGKPSNIVWEIYQMATFFPQEATFWPDRSDLELAAVAKVDLEVLIREGLGGKVNEEVLSSGQKPKKLASNGPDRGVVVRLKTRGDYLKLQVHPDELTPALRDHAQWLERQIYEYPEETGMYGNWKLALPPLTFSEEAELST